MNGKVSDVSFSLLNKNIFNDLTGKGLFKKIKLFLAKFLSFSSSERIGFQ